MSQHVSSPARRSSWITWMLCMFVTMAWAERIADPSDEFLAYLGDLEDSDDNWADFAEESSGKPPANEHQTSSSSSTSSTDYRAGAKSARSRT